MGLGGLHLVRTQSTAELCRKLLPRCRRGQGLTLRFRRRRSNRRFLGHRRFGQRWRNRRPGRMDRRSCPDGWLLQGLLCVPRVRSADNAKDLLAPRTTDPVVRLDTNGSDRGRRAAVVWGRFRSACARRHGRNREPLPARRTRAMRPRKLRANLESLLAVRTNNYHCSPLSDAFRRPPNPCSIKHLKGFVSTVFRLRKKILDCVQLN